MTDNTQPEALRLADELEAEFAQWSISNHTCRKAATELLRQHARIAELEAQLESIGAGGVSGPLMDRAPLAASVGSEPVASIYITPAGAREMDDWKVKLPPGRNILYTHPSPPEGMVGGWMPIETAPKGELVLLWSSVKRGGPFIGDWADYMRCNQPRFTHWSRWIPTPPTTSAGSGKGE